MANIGDLGSALKGLVSSGAGSLGKGFSAVLGSGAGKSVAGAAATGVAFSGGAVAAKGIFGLIGRFLKWLFSLFFPMNLPELSIVYYTLQWLIDIVYFGGYSQIVLIIYIVSTMFFGVAYFFSALHNVEQGGLRTLLGVLVGVVILLGIPFLLTFVVVPQLMQMNISIPYVSRVFIPIYPLWFMLTKARQTRLRFLVTYSLILTAAILIGVLAFFGVGPMEIFSALTVHLSKINVPSFQEQQQARSFIETAKLSMKNAWHGFNKLLNGSWVDDITKGYEDEKVEGEYNEEATRMAISLSYPEPATPRIVRYGKEEYPTNTIFSTIEYTQRPSEDCLIYGLCDTSGYVNVSCSVDKEGVEVKTGNSEKWGISANSLYDVDTLRYTPVIHTCDLRVGKDAQPGLIDVQVKAEYDYVGASNFDLVFADEQLKTSCAASDQSELACLGYNNINLVSESSSGPVLLSMGLPSAIRQQVIPVGEDSGMTEVPLLISISNKYEGRMSKINNLFVAFPQGMTPLEKGLCHFENAVQCNSVFGKGLSGYTCYQFDTDFLNQKHIMEMLMKSSIMCVLDIDEDTVLESGSKAVKNIKAYLNYSYEVTSKVSIEYTIWDQISADKSEGNLKGKCRCNNDQLLYSFCNEGKIPSCDVDSCSCVEDEEDLEFSGMSCVCEDNKPSDNNCGSGYTPDCLEEDFCGCVVDT